MELANEIARVRRDARQLRSADEVNAAIATMARQIEERLSDANPVILAVMDAALGFAMEPELAPTPAGKGKVEGGN